MKSLLRILLLTLALNLHAQERLAFSVLQDARLAVLGDERGNDAFTTDMVFRLHMDGYDNRRGYFSTILEYEYAELSGAYFKRLSFAVQQNKYVKDFTLSASLNYGILIRSTKDYSYNVITGGLNLDATYNLSDRVGIVLSNQLMHRKDLEVAIVRYSFMAGLKFKLTETGF